MKQTLPQKHFRSPVKVTQHSPEKATEQTITGQNISEMIRHLKKHVIKPSPRVVEDLLKRLQ